jgi:hypothetical protein
MVFMNITAALATYCCESAKLYGKMEWQNPMVFNYKINKRKQKKRNEIACHPLSLKHKKR